MRRYKGYYLDGVIFKTESEVDEMIKNEIIRKIRIFHDMLFNHGERYTPYEQMKICEEITNREKRLHDEYSMSWEDIEEIPFTA